MNGRVWLSQVLGASDGALLMTPGIPNANKWKNIVMKGLKKRSGGSCNRKNRMRCYDAVQRKARELAPALWKVIEAGVRCRNDALVAVGATTVEAWHAVTGKIPILWTEAVLGAGVGRSAYEKWLRWYEKEIRNGLWWP